MKTKTINTLLVLLKGIEQIYQEMKKDTAKRIDFNIATNILESINILEKEKQRKEQKKPKLIHFPSTGCLLTIESIEKLLKEKDKKINELIENNKSIEALERWTKFRKVCFGRNTEKDCFSITPTGKVIINDGEKFDELFMKLAKAYLDSKKEDKITIVKDKLFDSGTRIEQERKQYLLNIENGFELTKYGGVNIFCRGAFKNYIDKLTDAYKAHCETSKVLDNSEAKNNIDKASKEYLSIIAETPIKKLTIQSIKDYLASLCK